MGGVNSSSEMFTSAVSGQRGDTILRFFCCFVGFFFLTLQCLLNTIKMFFVFLKPVAEKRYFKPRRQVCKGFPAKAVCCC